MTHSDSITLLLDLKASELEFPTEDFLTLGYSTCIGIHQAQIFHANYRPHKTICPQCGVISEERKVHCLQHF